MPCWPGDAVSLPTSHAQAQVKNMINRSESEPFEEAFLDVLQNIEASIIHMYYQNPQLNDLQVDAAIEALIRTYQGESKGQLPAQPRSEQAKAVYQAVQSIGEWRLGRQGFKDDERRSIKVEQPLVVNDWIACLKRIRKSIRLWNKKSGSQGYLNYISHFIK